ncbi:MAG: serine/threonine protein kinase [Deltaproteobacteria bacterium]|nr:serine/threonine protein kinase [Deltaproteobacteria bacterium]MDQ3299724.1 serine/threonine protein kinase [Myxococcota bacterium]
MIEDETIPGSLSEGGTTARGRTHAADGVGERYALGGVIGRGGMGEIRIARDTRIDREVAVKLMHASQEDEATVTRFFREARVQGGLEHPAVVPVHDLGIDANGHPYFVMKRLVGTTLAEVLAATDKLTRERWPRRKLLARLVDICLAVEFAHTRGVIHRDLKPANVMFGDFGETYVLDWGLARIADDAASFRTVHAISGERVENATLAGELLGTPGYMSPEQARGEAVDAATDVFSIGCLLYELLAGRAALPRGLAAIEPTISTPYHRPSAVASDVPPELDDLCAAATAADRTKRPTARALADSVQAYLDGDRDLARRNELAEEHAQRARQAFTATGDAARAEAMREAGRALALDPGNATALDVIGHLLVAAPTSIPAEALATADRERAAIRRSVIKLSVQGLAGLTLAGAVFFTMRVHHVWPIVLMQALTALTAGVAFMVSRRDLPVRTPWALVLLFLNCAVIASSCICLGPLFAVPIFFVGSLAAWLFQPTGYAPWIVVVSHAVAVVPAIVLEATGVVPRTFRLTGDALELSPWAFDLSPVAAVVVMSLAVIMQCAMTATLAIKGRVIQEDAQNRVHAQSWHLRQLVPTDRKSEPRGDA